MERLTQRYKVKVITDLPEAAISRLAAIEDILGDDYDLDRLREIAEAEREGRVRIKPKMPKCPRCGASNLVRGVTLDEIIGGGE